MQAKQFDKKAFELSFSKSLKNLDKSEKVTRSEILTLSRSVLEATHETGDIAFVNRMLKVLTPVNRKTAVLYFKEFTGFKHNSETGEFTTKDKKHYDEKQELCVKFLEDPLNNLWSWAERNVDVEPKEFTLEKVGKTFASQLKKATDAGFTQADVLKQVLAQGIELDTVLALLGSMYDVEVDAKV